MRFPLLFLFVLPFLAACTSPSPSGRTLVSVSWHNPTPQSFRFAEVSLGAPARPVLIEEIPAYAEPSAVTSIPLNTRPMAQVVFQYNGQSIRPPSLSLAPSLRTDPRDEYHLRIHVLEPATLRAELEPASTARERLKSASPVL